MTPLRARAPLAAFALLALSACGDDDHPVEPGESGLTQQQTVAVFNSFMDVSNKVLSGEVSSRAAPGAISAAMAPQPFELTGPCPLGGNLSFQGAFTDDVDNNGTGTSAFDLTETPNGCKANSSLGQLTFDGDPNLQVSYALDWKDHNPTLFRWTMKGALRFSGALAGSCTADLSYTLDYGTKKSSMSGKMCGHELRLGGGG